MTRVARHHHQVSSGKNPEPAPGLAVSPLMPTHAQNPPEPQPCARKNSRTPSRLPNRIIRNGEAAANFIALDTPAPDRRTRLYSSPNTADARRAGTRAMGKVVTDAGRDSRKLDQHRHDEVAEVVIADGMPGQPRVLGREKPALQHGVEKTEVHGLFGVVDGRERPTLCRPKAGRIR